jgi:ADP-ribosyl-[dinitrogen reductase] hydrolase
MHRARGCLLGLAVGDAVGTTAEFRPRGGFEPVTDLVGGGPFNLEPGQWTDDTSMALCLADSLITRHGFDARDQMERYVRWARHGYLSSTGSCFDIGYTVSAALRKFDETGEVFAGATDPNTAGNGCLMRLAPIPIFYAHDANAAIHHAGESSRTTHGARECIDACRYYAALIVLALDGAAKDVILNAPAPPNTTTSVENVAAGASRNKEEDEIHTTGYVMHSLEAALWCFARTDNYADAVLTATNLGDDADTTAAIVGQLAGAHYGLDGIPADWRAKITLHDQILGMADALAAPR